MRKAVVFGGTGWVGHYVALDLKAHGYEVVVASRGKKIEDYEVGLGDIPRVVLDKSNAAEIPEELERTFWEYHTASEAVCRRKTFFHIVSVI